MKAAIVLSSLALTVSLTTANAQNTPTKLTQPVTNPQNQAPQEDTSDPRFKSRYGTSRPTSRAAAPAPAPAVQPVAAPVPVPAPAAVAAPAAAPAPAAAENPEDPRFRSRYGSARPTSRVAAPTAGAAPVAVAAPQAGAPGAAVAVPAVAPVRPADPEREQRIINFQRQSAISGNRTSQYDLGMRYMKGDGVEQDNKEALRWLTLAAKNGNSRAKKQLEVLTKKMKEAGESTELEDSKTEVSKVPAGELK